jgi:hypothetical protein
VNRLNNRFAYWLAGWIGILLHPIRVPIEIAKITERIAEGEEMDQG